MRHRLSDNLKLLPFAVSSGELAGIGGEITLATWQASKAQNLPVFFYIGNIDHLHAVANSHFPDTPIIGITNPSESYDAFDKGLPVINIEIENTVNPGELDPTNGHAAIEAINKGVAYCQNNKASGLITNPIHKSNLYEAGFRFPGHTEYLAHLAGVERTVMMLVCDELRSVPVTVHTSLKTAIKDLTEELIITTCTIVAADLKHRFGLKYPRLAISGLNPHAGENGALGGEEQDIISPAIKKLCEDGITAFGPLPADTMFHPEARETYDVAICMYHDQALIPVKTLDFHGGVNVTLGLPFIRTSPDHGTALNLAGRGKANPSSLISAIKMAQKMSISTQDRLFSA